MNDGVNDMQTIYIVGDSTVDTNTPPYYGWGGQLAPLLPHARIVNTAASGRSSKSFLDEGLFAETQRSMQPGDLLLVGFGHNDEKDDAARHTDPETTFPQMLMVYVEAARKAGAVPVLCTSVSRNFFVGAEGDFLLYTHGAYPAAERSLCQREGVALIDLEKQTRALLLSKGAAAACELFVNLQPGEDERYPQGIEDKTHFSLLGAQTVAQMVAQGLVRLGLVDQPA